MDLSKTLQLSLQATVILKQPSTKSISYLDKSIKSTITVQF